MTKEDSRSQQKEVLLLWNNTLEIKFTLDYFAPHTVIRVSATVQLQYRALWVDSER